MLTTASRAAFHDGGQRDEPRRSVSNGRGAADALAPRTASRLEAAKHQNRGKAGGGESVLGRPPPGGGESEVVGESGA